MEDHYPLDISVRNVAVRLNETNTLNSEMNRDNVCSHSVFCSSTAEQSKETSCLNDECSEKINTTASNITEEFRDKLHVSESSDSCELLNGCNKLLHDDIKRVDFAVNGLMKCNSVERINACIDQLNHRTCIEKSVEPLRTESSVKNVTVETVNSEDDCLSSSTVLNPSDVHMHSSEAIWEVEQVESYHNMLHSCCGSDANIRYLGYDSESQMPDIMRLIQKDLSEPYSIYTYRYFIHNWPKLCFLAQDDDKCVGAIVCKLDVHKKHSRRGYIAMLAVDENYRKKKIGSNLVLKAINAMVQDCADEVVLETEITNKPALRLYENLGFVRDKRLFRYYLNGVDALRLKLWLR